MLFVPPRLMHALNALSGVPSLSMNLIAHTPQMRELIESCAESFPAAIDMKRDGKPDLDSVRWALVNALNATGVPKPIGPLHTLSPEPEVVAQRIAEGMNAREIRLLHLCPMDLADDFPTATFGPCEVRTFTQEELSHAFQAPRLARNFPGYTFDAKRFSRFTWLVVQESIPSPPKLSGRSFPFLNMDFSRDFGAITPHSKDWPEIVERAIFELILLPWEDLMSYGNTEWRGFRVPWVYTATSDLFASPAHPREPDSLTWEPYIYDDERTGETIEIERPLIYPLIDNIETTFAELSDTNWEKIGRAIASPIFNPLCVHFLVRAFISDGIDEFLAHVTAVEAALGLQRDYDPRSRPKLERGINPGATERVARRAAAITRRAESAVEFRELFNLRSAFLHGRELGSISSKQRMMARTLARRVVSELVRAGAANNSEDRDAFLSQLCP